MELKSTIAIDKQFIEPFSFPSKNDYISDLIEIDQSLIGRLDIWYTNEFLKEAVQMIYNSLTLFELGYFDAAFYSLRQSLEILTTAIYFFDGPEEETQEKLKKWKIQGKFPSQTKIVDELKERNAVFKDVKEKLRSYFDGIENTKQKLNKFVHKQGYSTFYVSINNPFSPKKETIRAKIATDFEKHLRTCIGGVAVLRLIIDPFPLLLMDEAIYNRTGQLLADGHSVDFVKKYIGKTQIEAFKQTEIYKNLYDSILSNEEMCPAILNIVKNDYIDPDRITEILSQKHLLDKHSRVAVCLAVFSNKVTKTYCLGGFHWYFTNTKSNRNQLEWGTNMFKEFEAGDKKYNNVYHEVFISHVIVANDSYFIEHNEEFTETEISELAEILKVANQQFENISSNHP